MITDEQLREWKQMTEAATPEPWEYFENLAGQRSVIGPVDSQYTQPCKTIVACPGPRKTGTADMKFTAEARKAMPLLVAEVERLRAQLEATIDKADQALKDIAACESMPMDAAAIGIGALSSIVRDEQLGGHRERIERLRAIVRDLKPLIDAHIQDGDELGEVARRAVEATR